jgi:hypothetical protein
MIIEKIVYLEDFLRTGKEREAKKELKEDIIEIRRLIYRINSYEKPLKTN